MPTDPSKLKRPLQPMPDFVREALAGRGLTAAYEARPAYQQNDYLGWINRAKRHETQEKRLAQMLDELEAGGVYMKMAHPASAKQADESPGLDESLGLKDVLELSRWQEAEDALAERFGLRISKANDRILELEQQRFGRTDFDLQDVVFTLEDANAHLLRFSEAWFIDCKSREYGQEWDPREGDQQADTPKKSVVVGITQGFLLNYTLFFLYAERCPEKLETYLKKSRIPHARKVAKDIRRVFEATANHE